MATDQDLRVSRLLAEIHCKARHRALLDRCKLWLWTRTDDQSGISGWLGDRCDAVEHLSMRLAAWRYRRRNSR